jgi:Two component regulator propeller.
MRRATADSGSEPNREFFGRIHGETLEALDVDEPVLGIAEARNGDAWLATRDRVLQVRSARPQHIARETRLSARFLSGPVQTADGAIWVSTETAILRVDTDAESPAVMRAGRFWLTSDTRGEIVPTDVSHVAVRTAYRDSFGTTWIGTVGAGLLRSLRSSASAPETFAHADGLANDAVWAVFEDREHNLWIGTQNGLQSFRDVRFRTLRWPREVDGLVAGRDNTVWTATPDGLARVGAQATRVHLTRDRIMAMTGDHRGRVWVYTPASVVSLADGGDETIQLDRGSSPHDVVAMAVDNADTVWLCDRTRGVLRWRNQQS